MSYFPTTKNLVNICGLLLTSVDSKTKWNIEKVPFLTILREFQNDNMDWRSQQVLTKYFLSKTMMFQLSKFVSTILLRDLMVILSQSEFFHENQYFPKSWKKWKIWWWFTISLNSFLKTYEVGWHGYEKLRCHTFQQQKI